MHDECGNQEKVLHSNAVGCITQCIHCEDLLIKVENILYSTNIKSYNSLLKILYYVKENIEDHTVEILNKSYILICTPNDNINLCFSAKDFDLLIDLFEQSKLMLEVNQLFS
jgi:hypothetical protein